MSASIGGKGVQVLTAVNGGKRYKPLLLLTFIEHSSTLAKSHIAAFNSGQHTYLDGQYACIRDQEYASLTKVVQKGRERFYLCTLINKAIGKKYLITDRVHKEDDFYQFLMMNYRLPLLEEWTKHLIDELCFKRGLVQYSVDNEHCYVGWSGMDLPGVVLHGEEVDVRDILVFDFTSLDEEDLKAAVSDSIKEGYLKVAPEPSNPLVFETFDEYITKYGPTLVQNLESSIETLTPLKGDLDGFSAKNKRLFPQQAACINGINALLESGSKYAYVIEGMGCGKTIQGIAAAESFFNQKWLKQHKGKSLKDLYMTPNAINYRNIVMAPSHLVHKWKDEIESEIPFAEATIVKNIKQLMELKDGGRKRNGKQWFLISKDNCKIGMSRAPIPTKVKKMAFRAPMCLDCYEEDGSVHYKMGTGRNAACPSCGNKKRFELRAFSYHQYDDAGNKKLVYHEREGLTCPKCSNLLIKYSTKYCDCENNFDNVLTPKDFATNTENNKTCYTCGARLWGMDADNLVLPGGKAPEPKWYKVKHYKNHQKKGTGSVYVLKGYEDDYRQSAKLTDGWEVCKRMGKRKFAPADYIKKYLKGYFDFCLLDEVHKYEGAGTAQAVAAHSLIKASKYTLGMTGTITNGKADSFFHLFFMLDPGRMLRKGYTYDDIDEFCKYYGAVETRYEAKKNPRTSELNAMSRGKKLGQPKLKPGISPVLFIDFLMDKSVFLDLSDLSRYLPPLKEMVTSVPCPDDVKFSYDNAIAQLNAETRKPGGFALRSTALQLGLSYPDRPYGISPILHPYYENQLVVAPSDLKHYADGDLLPKEEELLRLVRSEVLDENRNMFIYVAYSADAEKNVLWRLRDLVEERCNLKNQVLVMESKSTPAEKRELYIRQNAQKGIRVFICNMELVETGLDFCFSYEGRSYNYPTIVFYQISYKLATVWQASRRHYRLNQTEECRTYYLCTEGTLQMTALELMATKQCAASSIQGKFSTEGLSTLAKGIDEKVVLARRLAENDMTSRESLESMFDVLNQRVGEEDEAYSNYAPPKTYYEIMGDDIKMIFDEDNMKTIESKPKKVVTKPKTKTTQISLFDFQTEEIEIVLHPHLVREPEAKTKQRAKKELDGQLTLTSLFAA